VNSADHRGVGALVAAASKGHTDCVRALLDFNADVSLSGPLGTAEEAAITGQHNDCVLLLMEVDEHKPSVRAAW
jgi:ankyrin repeat protein